MTRFSLRRRAARLALIALALGAGAPAAYARPFIVNSAGTFTPVSTTPLGGHTQPSAAGRAGGASSDWEYLALGPGAATVVIAGGAATRRRRRHPAGRQTTATA